MNNIYLLADKFNKESFALNNLSPAIFIEKNYKRKKIE